MQPEAQNNKVQNNTPAEVITSVNVPTPGQGIVPPESPQELEQPMIQEHRPPLWPFFLFLVLLVSAVVFGYIFAARKMSQEEPSPTPIPIVIPPFPSVAPRSQTPSSTSDAIVDIERDLESINISGLDTELPNLEQERQNL